MKRFFFSIASVVALLLALLVPVPAAAGGRAICPGAAGFPLSSLPKTAPGDSHAGLGSVVAQHGTCWDRIIFLFDVTVHGYRVAYEAPFTEGRGLPMAPFTAGGAVLNVVLFADSHPEGFAPGRGVTAGSHAAFGSFLTFRTLRDGLYGGSFEGRTTFSIGVRARLPMRVTVLSAPPRIVLDVLHVWP